MAADYFKKLQDPRWQKKRLEVMSANEFRCGNCGDDSQQLHVHHKGYLKGREPWEYDTDQLECLCSSCHSTRHDDDDLLKLVCTFGPADGPGNRWDAAFLLAGFFGFKEDRMAEVFGDLVKNKKWKAMYEIGQSLLWQDMDCRIGEKSGG